MRKLRLLREVPYTAQHHTSWKWRAHRGKWLGVLGAWGELLSHGLEGRPRSSGPYPLSDGDPVMTMEQEHDTPRALSRRSQQASGMGGWEVRHLGAVLGGSCHGLCLAQKPVLHDEKDPQMPNHVHRKQGSWHTNTLGHLFKSSQEPLPYGNLQIILGSDVQGKKTRRLHVAL